MPDLFVAPNDQNTDDADLHQRKPAAPTETSVQKPQATQQPIVSPSPTTPLSVPPEPARIKESATINRATSNIPLFTSFWQNPTGIYFDTQEIDEHILLFLRRHPITNLPWVASSILLLLLPFAGMYVSTIINRSFIFGSPGFTIAILIFYFLLVLTSAFTNFLNWYYNISLVTEKRVIDIELNNLVGKKIAATKIALVQDVDYQQSGTIRSIFDYGDVLVQTAGAVDNFYMQAIPKPEVVVRVLENIIGESGHRV